MLLLRTTGSDPRQENWSASASIRADAEDVLAALTDPEAIAGWAPVSFEVQGLGSGRLEAGSRERVTGRIAGIQVVVDVEVRRADLEGVELTASGPVGLEVAYRFLDHGTGVFVEARVRVVRQVGLTAQLVQAAVATMLNSGALDRALQRLEASLDRRVDSGLVTV